MARARTTIGGSPSSASSSGSSKAKASGGGGSNVDKSKMIKIAAASIIGLAAIVLLLVNTGVLDLSGTPKPPPDLRETLSPEEQVQYDKEQKERERLDKIRPPSGA